MTDPRTEAEVAPADLENPERIPPLPPRKGWLARLLDADERSQLERDASQSHNIRRMAAYGALLCAALLFAAAAWSALRVLHGATLPAENGYLATVALAALFLVPTVLVLAVLRKNAPSEAPDLLPQEWLGQKLMALLDKLLEKL